MNLFLDFIKKQDFFSNLIGISEINARETTVTNKIFSLLN